MSERASTVPSVTLSDESSISRPMLSSSVITMSPSVSISAISADLLRTPSQSPPTFYPEREDDATHRPLSPPSDLGQVGRRRSPVSESWYTCPRPPPTAEEATEVEWRPEPGTTIVPPSHVIGSQLPPLRPHPDQIVPIEQVLGSVQPQPTGATGVSGLPDYNELLDLVRGGAGSQEVLAEQQREIIRYLGGLNTWLERDVIDRQFEPRQLSERMDQLRDEPSHRLGRPPTPLMYRPPYGPQIVGKVPAGGVVIPPIPDAGCLANPAVPESSFRLPCRTAMSRTPEMERSFQIPPVYGQPPQSGPVIPSHISTTDESTFESTASTGNEDFEVPVIPPVIPPDAIPPAFEASRPPFGISQESIVIPPLGSPSGVPGAPFGIAPQQPVIAVPPPAQPPQSHRL
ncbi:hypothetical protein FRC08_000616 [Ceratobasidium sp. 394]|nr:hypothetical protein FRC08_000616 [Ceratobasidium sp. 394]